MKKHQHLFLILGLVAGAYVLYTIAAAVIAGERSLLKLLAAPWTALESAANSIGSLLMGSTPDPKAANPDAAAVGITNLDGSPITNEQAGLSVIGIDPFNNALNNPNNPSDYFNKFNP